MLTDKKEVIEEETEETPDKETIEGKKAEENKEGKGKVGWDKERQRADQEAANARRARAAAEDAYAKLATRELEFDEAKKELGELKAKLTSTAELGELDPDTVDLGVIKHINRLQKRLDDAEKNLDGQKAKIVQYEKLEAGRESSRYKEQMIEKILTPLDKKYGAKYRNAAKKMADDLVNSGEEKVPTDALDARDLLEDCYIKVSGQDKETSSKKTSSVKTDTGEGNMAVDFDGIGEGKLEDVWEKMKTKINKKGGLKFPSVGD